MTTKSCTRNLGAATYERNSSMNNIALRSDCSNARPVLLFVVTSWLKKREFLAGTAVNEPASSFPSCRGRAAGWASDASAIVGQIIRREACPACARSPLHDEQAILHEPAYL